MKLKNIAACVISVIGLTLFGCASAKKAPEGVPGQPPGQGKQGQVYGPGEVYGPPEPPVQPVYGPEPIQLRPVVLVLGPGGARGYAYVGALRAIAEAKIPVAAVYGSEMGALFGALYAMSGGSLSKFEWGLLKFPDDVFVSNHSLISNLFDKASDGKKLESALSKVFGDKDLSASRIPVSVALRLKDKDLPETISQGLARAALRAAVASPGLFDAGKWDGHAADSAVQSWTSLISQARATGKGSVIVIDASGDPRFADQPELKDADFVLRPDMKGIGALDFSKKTEAAFRGKTEVNQHLPELRHLAGMPNEGPSP